MDAEKERKAHVRWLWNVVLESRTSPSLKSYSVSERLSTIWRKGIFSYFGHISRKNIESLEKLVLILFHRTHTVILPSIKWKARKMTVSNTMVRSSQRTDGIPINTDLTWQWTGRSGGDPSDLRWQESNATLSIEQNKKEDSVRGIHWIWTTAIHNNSQL